MRVLVQKSNAASVTVDGKIYSKIPNGLVLLVAFTKGDNIDTIKYMVKKIINLRIFPDDNDIMNKNVLDCNGEILSVSQFTLYANTKKGNRPSYIEALKSDKAEVLFDEFNNELKKYIEVKTGKFGADMEVSITNVGPTTIWLER
jgi:D-aminoacyl-tRNA deacylase